MSTPVYIRIYNYTDHAITTDVTDHRDLENSGKSFDDKTIQPDDVYESSVEVKTGIGNGELTITIKEGSATLGFFKMKDLKNPHEGVHSIQVPNPPEHPIQFSYVAYRKIDNMPEDNRYIYLVVNKYPEGSKLP